MLFEVGGSFVPMNTIDTGFISNIFTNPAIVTTQAYDDFTWDEPAYYNSANELVNFATSANMGDTYAYFSWHANNISNNTSTPVYIDALFAATTPQWFFIDPAESAIGGLSDGVLEENLNDVNNLGEVLTAWLITYAGVATNGQLFPGLGTMPGPFGVDVNYSQIVNPNNGEKNYLTLSVNGTANDTNPWATAGADPFLLKAELQKAGTLFRFTGDPNQNVYKVVTRIIDPLSNVDLQDWNDNVGFESETYNLPITINSLVCRRQNHTLSSTEYKNRETILVPFVRIDTLTGAVVPNSGIDIQVWDPRGDVKHNGVGSFGIEIVTQQSDIGLADTSAMTNKACWETEPKKDADLDVYYEASSAIPMRLTEDNIYTFVQPNTDYVKASKFKINKRVLSNGTTVEFPDLAGTPSVREIYSNNVVAIADNDDTNDSLYITPSIVYGDSQPSAVGVAIDDQVAFRNKNGTTTISKVLDHVNLDGTKTQRVSLLAPTSTYAPAQYPNPYGVIAIDPNSFVIPSWLTQEAVNSGIEVRGSNIEKGTFIVGVLPLIAPIFYEIIPGLPLYIYINKPPISNNISDFAQDIELIKTSGIFQIDTEVWKYSVELGWHNCYSFGNGVESDRIRDDFNAPQIDNGNRVSSTFLEYGKETIGSGIIYSGLYNSISSVNNLNEFNMAEKITKSLNPAYGSIQALKTRDTDVVVFTEDKVLKVLSNKDAVFNADGNAQLTATNRVLGQAIPFVGDYGISKNPESLASDQYRIYFADKQRGAILRLSNDGLTPISNVGMRGYFREHLKLCDTIIGNFDIVNGEYNVTLNIATNNQTAEDQPITASFNEGSKGWISFKSFIPTSGASVNGKYFTTYDNGVYEHYSNNVNRNTFYGQSLVPSEIEVVFNDMPGIVKSFKTINYEGSQAKIDQFTSVVQDGNTWTDGEYYNLAAKNGWYVDQFNTDLQEGQVVEFIEKENKWFNKISGVANTLDNIDMSELSVQGIGFPSENSTPNEVLDDVNLTISDTGDTP
jgi:hypothetical protein